MKRDTPEGVDMSDTFFCARCKREYPKSPDWTDADKDAEMYKNFPGGIAEEDRAIVCDDCYEFYRVVTNNFTRTDGYPS